MAVVRNQWSDNPSCTYGAIHIRMRKVRGPAREQKCWAHLEYGHSLQAAEWAQIHCSDGDDPWGDFIPLCRPCHRWYDRTRSAVALSNMARKGEKRKQYIVRNIEAYRAAQAARSRVRWGGDAT